MKYRYRLLNSNTYRRHTQCSRCSRNAVPFEFHGSGCVVHNYKLVRGYNSKIFILSSSHFSTAKPNQTKIYFRNSSSTNNNFKRLQHMLILYNGQFRGMEYE